MTKRTIAGFFLSLLIAQLAPAQTIIPGGNVSGIWVASGSPYLIEGEITIPSSDTLAIEPGVDVIFQGHYKLIVNGWLEAIGTESDSILFTAADTSVGWDGFHFFNALVSSSLSYCVLEYGKASDGYGGAVHCDEADPVFQHCTIRNNYSVHSGGGFCLVNSNAAIIHCTIQCNTAESDGGGIFCSNSDPLISNCIISDNFADWNSGICCMFSTINIEDCTINGNTANHDAGGISCQTSTGIISGCIISGNASGGVGGGIQVSGLGRTIEITDCVIMGNEGLSGGGISLYYANNTIIADCFISNNVTHIAGGAGIKLSPLKRGQLRLGLW